jgi:hypothetical protein
VKQSLAGASFYEQARFEVKNFPDQSGVWQHIPVRSQNVIAAWNQRNTKTPLKFGGTTLRDVTGAVRPGFTLGPRTETLTDRPAGNLDDILGSTRGLRQDGLLRVVRTGSAAGCCVA